MLESFSQMVVIDEQSDSIESSMRQDSLESHFSSEEQCINEAQLQKIIVADDTEITLTIMQSIFNDLKISNVCYCSNG